MASRVVLPPARGRAMSSWVAGWPRGRVTMTRRSAALIWRLPPWSSRWRCVLPELAGIGATPAARASLAAVAKRCAPATSPTSLAAISGPNPGWASNCGAIWATSTVISRSSWLIAAVSSRRRRSSSRDPNAHRLLRAGEPPADAGTPLLREQRAARQPQLGPQIVQMPQQRVVELDAMTDQPFAVIDQQPQVEFRSVQVRGREGPKALLHHGAGDVERVQRIRLAPLTGAPACIRGQVRRDPQHPLAALDQESLQRSGDVPAVLERPHAVAVEAARPPQQHAEPMPAEPGRSARRAARRWRPLRRPPCANACECPRQARS